MMRCLMLCLLVILGLPDVCRADELPKRKPGLWEMTVTSDHGTQVIKQCSDAGTDAKMMQMGNQFGDMCSKPAVRRDGQKYVVEAECNMAGSKMNSKAVFSGDFTASYHGEVDSTLDPPFMNMGKMHSTISARYLGACAADQRPGDVIMANGMKLNLESLPKMKLPKLPQMPQAH